MVEKIFWMPFKIFNFSNFGSMGFSEKFIPPTTNWVKIQTRTSGAPKIIVIFINSDTAVFMGCIGEKLSSLNSCPNCKKDLRNAFKKSGP